MVRITVLQLVLERVFLGCGEGLDGCGGGGGGVAWEALFEVLLPEDVWRSVQGCEQGEADDGREVEGEGLLLEKACQLLSCRSVGAGKVQWVGD